MRALAFALVALATFAPELIPRTARIDIGGANDRGFVQYFSAPEVWQGTSVRWGEPNATIRFPHVPMYPATVRIRAAGTGSGPITIIARAAGASPRSAGVAAAFQPIALDVSSGPRAGELAIDLETRGSPDAKVAVDWVELETGGIAARAGGRWPLRGWTFLLLAAAAAAARTIAAAAGRPGAARVGIPVCAVAVAAAALVAFRYDLTHHLPALALIAVATACVLRLAVASHPPAFVERALSQRGGGTGVFLLAAAGLLAIFFSDAWLRGLVLSQTDLLYLFYPWMPYRPGPLRPGNPLMGDIPMVFYPFLAAAVKAFRHLELPLWNPNLYAGHPFFASFQSAVLSPFTAIAYLVPLPQATVAIAAARLLVGGAGMFVFLRHLGLGRVATLFGAVAYLLNPFSVVWLEHPVSAVAAWLPWLLWATDRAATEPRAANAAWLAVITALQLLSGHPETSFKLGMLAAPYGLLRVVSARAGARGLAALAAGYAVGGGLAAVQLVPFLEYLTHSRSYIGRQGFTTNPYTAPIATIITGLVPTFRGHPVAQTYIPVANAFGLASNYCEQQIYAGMATWLLASMAPIVCWREPRVRFLAVAGIVSALLMYGAPGMLQLASRLPLLRVAALSRFGLIAIAAGIVMASYTVDRVVEGRGHPVLRNWRVWLVAVAAALLFSAAIAVFYVHSLFWLEQTHLASATLKHCVLAIALTLTAAALIVLRERGSLRSTVFGAALLCLLSADLMFFGRGFHPLMAPRLVYPAIPEIDRLRSERGPFRVGGVDPVFLPNAGVAYELQDFRGYDGMTPARYGALLDAAFGPAMPFHRLTRLDGAPLLDLLNVKYVFTGPDAAPPRERFERLTGGKAPVYLNTRAFPRAFLVDHYRVEQDAAMLALLVRGGEDLRRVVLLETGVPESERPVPAPHAPGRASVRRYEPGVVEIETEADGRRLLVLTDAEYPGWRARVDDRPATIYRANYAFRAVSVPAGQHVVRFTYEPGSLKIGAALSGAAALVLIALAGVARRRPRTN